LGRTRFRLNLTQLHCHPNAPDFLRTGLALIVSLWEQNHSARHTYVVKVRDAPQVRYDPSPYTSLDVQRFALLTLECNPAFSITDLIWAAQQPQLVAPTPRCFLQVLDGVASTGEANGKDACQWGLHDLEEVDRIVVELPPLCQSTDESADSNERTKQSSYSLAQLFEEKTRGWSPLGANTRALAAEITRWRKKGFGYQVVEMMIDEFCRNFQSEGPNRKTPWKAFIAQCDELIASVEWYFSDKHQWDDGYEADHARLFGEFRAPRP